MKSYTLTTPEEGKDGKSYWHDIGVLFADEEATGINGSSIKLNMFPDLTIKVYHRDKKQGRKDTQGRNDPPDSSYQEPRDF